MDPLSLFIIQDSPEDEVVESKKQKKKGKSVSAKKAALRAAEEVRQLLLKRKQEFLKEIKARVQTEWERNHEKAPVFESEFRTKEVLLKKGAERLLEIKEAWEEYLKERRKEKEWMQYLKCDGLPDPSSCPEIKTYIYHWMEIDNSALMSHCVRKTEEVMQLLTGLEEIINDPGPDRPPSAIEDIKELRNELRDLLQENIDKATFYLFSRIHTDMESVNVTTSKYFTTCPQFQMSLWAELITPIPSKVKEVRKPLKVHCEDIQVTVTLPVVLLDFHKVMRAMLLHYDHWTDKCRTYDLPPLPKYHSQSMYDLFMSDFDEKVEIMANRELEEEKLKKKVEALPHEPTLSQEIIAWTSDPQKSLSEEVMYRKYKEDDDLGWQVKSMLNEFEVNLRERTFLGHLLLLEVLIQPPQAHSLRLKHSVTLRKKPPRLEHVEYYVKFPAPVDESEEEEEEEHVADASEAFSRRRETKWDKKNPDDEKDKLVVIRLLPDTSVLWFEEPQLANWDPVNGYWSTEDVHDVGIDEEDQMLTFRTGRFGLLGFHVSRYCNFPFEDWIFEGGEKEEVSFHLKTSKTALIFKIKAGEVCLEQMESPPSRAMNWILGKFYPPVELMKIMKKGGIDVFPGPDASSYLEDVEAKHVVIERNIYQVWALFSKSFRFRRSKFNQTAGRANIVFQAQEIDEKHQVDFCLILTTMGSCYVLDINEENENFSEKKAPAMKERVDLYSLLSRNCTLRAKRMSDTTCTMLIQTIKEFLTYIRPISFS